MSSSVNNLFKIVLRNKFVTQQIRFYPRWSHRRPVKVYTPEEYEGMEKKVQNVPKENIEKPLIYNYDDPKINWEQSKPPKRDFSETANYKVKAKKEVKPLTATHQKTKNTVTVDMLETVIDEHGNYVYTKMKNNDNRIAMILTEVKSKKEMDKKELILLEGKRLIKDALISGCKLKYILFSRKDELDYVKPFLPKVGANLYKMPYKEMQIWSDLTTNPGIMGIFRIPNVEEFKPQQPLPLTIICDNVREPGNLGTILRICAAVGCERVILSKGCVNLWDSKVLRSSVGAHFKLRIYKSLEWEQIEKEIHEHSNVFIADNKIVSESSDNNKDLITILQKIPVLPYYSVDFKLSNHIVLIIGGETLGISNNSYKFAEKLNGARLNIPLSNDVDSLNVGAALAIIAFELKKQLIQKNVK